MKFREVIGIDVGKLRNEAVIHSCQHAFGFGNTLSGFGQLLKAVVRHTQCDRSELLFVFEHTGIYSCPLSLFLAEQKLSFVLVSGLEVKRSAGIQRGKDDRVDAKRIALYAYRRLGEIVPTQLPSRKMDSIKRLLSLRDRLIAQRAGYKKNIKENGAFLNIEDNRVFFAVQEKVESELSGQIDDIDKELDAIVQSDDVIMHQFELMTSIKGVGKMTALYMIAFTNGFTLFSSWRKFASYAGTAPFPYQSGISIRGRTKVNHLANKKFKSLLNLCATTSIICNPEIKAYYEKKKGEGKNGMSVINAIRNKILARIFAVVNRNTPYVAEYKYAS